MTEKEWLKSPELYEMLNCLCRAGQATDRKLSLFAVACCRRIWHLLPCEASRTAVVVVEQFTDGLAAYEELESAHAAAADAADLTPRPAGNTWEPDGVASFHAAWA